MQFVAKRWLKTVWSRLSQPRQPLSSRKRPRGRLLLEQLEDRLTPSNTITTIAGTGSSGYNGDNMTATSATLYLPFGTAVDSSGNVFIADTYNNRIREVVKATGNIITVAGTGSAGYSGDNGPAASAQLYLPYGVAVDASGNLFIADTDNSRIREVVKATGNIITLAGTGSNGFSGDGGAAASAKLNAPASVAVDGSGNVFIADEGNNRIREVVKATGNISTLAGTGSATYNGDGGTATSAALNQPSGVAVDANDNVFIADWHNNRIREVVKSTGLISTIAGTGSAGYNGDGGSAASAQINYPNDVAVDASGNVFFSDQSNYRIREVVKATGLISTIAGTGTRGYSGDGASATSAQISSTYGVAVDGGGNVYFADYGNYRIREVALGLNLGALSNTAWTVNQTGFSSTIAVTGGTAPYSNLTVAGLPTGLTASLSGNTITVSGTPTAAGTFSSINLSIKDSTGATASAAYTITINAAPTLGALSTTQWSVDAPGYTGAIPISGGTGPFTVSAQANLPPGLTAVVSGTNITFTGTANTAGTFNNVQLTVKDAASASVAATYAITIFIPPAGSIISLAGNGAQGYGGDGGPGTAASLYQPWGVAVDGSGNVFFADYQNSRIREIVKATGNILTVAGNGGAGFSGDGGPATSAQLYWPTGVAVDASGNLYIADSFNSRIREVVKSTGVITTIAGNGGTTDSGDGGPAASAAVSPIGVAVDASGNVYITESYSNRVREVVKATGVITTIAGNGTAGFSGDGGPAPAAELSSPDDVVVDASGNVFIADQVNERIREVVKSTGNIITVAGNGSTGYSGDGGLATSAKLYGPDALAVDAGGNLFIADTDNNRIREVVKATGNIVTIAGTGAQGYSGDGGPATSATMYNPQGVAVDAMDNLFIADTYNNRVREVLGNPPLLGALSNTAWTINQAGYSGSITVTAGTAPYGNLTVTGLPAGLSASLSGPTITFSGTPTATGTFSGINVSVTDSNGVTGSHTYTLTINAAPTLGSLSATQGAVSEGYTGAIPISGGTGPFTVSAQANLPPGLNAAVSGTSITVIGTPTTAGTFANVQLTVTDAAGVTASGAYTISIIVLPTGSIVTVAGNSTYGYGGDGGAAFATPLYNPRGVAVDSSGNVFIADQYNNRIREVVKATGDIITVAGVGAAGFSGDGGPAASAQLYNPTGVAVDSSGNLFIVDYYNSRIREVVKATGVILTVAGTGSAGYSGDGGAATSAMLDYPTGVAVDSSGNLYIADLYNQRIREVAKATGNITTIVGTGSAGFSGDGGAATSAKLAYPDGVAVDASGNVYIADTNNSRVREVVKATGIITTIAGTGSLGYSGDGGAATAAQLYSPEGVSVDASGNVFIADSSNHRIREVVQATSTIVTVAGTGASGYSGEGGPATSAALNEPYSVAVDATGDVFLADTYNNRVREVLGGPLPGALSNTAWTINQAGYSGTIGITGGTAPYGNLTVTGLPAGLSGSLSGSTITVSGTPAATGVFSGINVSVTDANGMSGSHTYTITINAAPTLGTLSATAWTVNQAGFSGAVGVTGGTSAFSSLTATGLPAGLTAALSGSTIILSGTPTATGTFSSISISVKDAAGATASRTFSMTINAAPTLGALSATTWTVNQSGFSGAISIAGGTSAFSSLTATGLPAGLTAALSGSTIILSGTPIATGTFNSISISVKDAAGATASRTFSMTINAAPTLGSLSATAWTVNQFGFSSSISIAGGTPGFSNMTATGLPAGLTAALSGNTIFVSGTPTATGTFSNISISAKDATGATASRTFSMTINAAPMLGTMSATAWTVNQAGFSSAISIAGGTPVFSSLTATGLPTGLHAALSGSSIVLSGTPTATGAFNSISVSVRDAAGATASRTFSMTINAAPTLGTLSATAWTVNQAGFSSAISIAGGTPAFSSLITMGLPTGLHAALSGSTIVLSGTPTATGAFNSINVSVKDAAGATASRTFSMTINAAPTLGSLSATAWTANQAGFSSAISVAGGTSAFSNLTATGLPAGLTAALSGTTITLSGTPTAAGTFSSINVSVKDAAGATASRTFSMTINAAPTLGSLSVTAWTVNQAGFSGTIGVTGGTTAFSNLTASNLPAGLTAALAANTIILSGTPTTTGAFNSINVSVMDASGAAASATFSLTINPAPTLGSLTQAPWTVGASGYTGAIPISGGTGPLTLGAQANLPTGLTAVLSGTSITFTGTPTTVGTFNNVQLTVLDADGASSTGVYTITINVAPTLGAPTTTAWTVNQAGFSGAIGVMGGTSAFSNLTASGLPAGLTASLSGTTITLSGTPITMGVFNSISISVTDAAGVTASGAFSITINPAVLINTVAGDGTAGYSGDGGAATSAQLNSPSRVAVDGNGDLFITDTANNCIREVVQATGNIITVAGTGAAGYSGDGGAATSAQLNAPYEVAVDASGDLFIADTGNNCIREVVQATGNIITVAGTGAAGYSGDGAAATSAQMNSPQGVAVDANGDLFIADTANNCIREVVQATGNIITVAGTGAAGYSGDGGAATSAQLNAPYEVAVDASGDLFIADTGNNCIREVVQATGNIITVAGTGAAGYSGDGGAATSAQLNGPIGVAVDANGNLFIADTGNNCIREVVQATGNMVTIAGNGTAGYSGDGGLATSAQLTSPDGVAVDASGDVFVADTGNNCVRIVR